MARKAVNDMKCACRTGVLTIILAAAISGVCSAGPDESRLEQVKAGIRRYAIPPLELRLPPPASPLKPQVVFHGDRRMKRVALTFDACATQAPSGYDDALIRVLVETRTPATLFLGGKWMLDHPEETRKLAAVDRFELGNHSFLHPHITRIPEERVRQELEWTQIVIYSLTGRRASLFRPPYGEYDERSLKIAAELGFTTVQFDLASGDPGPGASKDRLVSSVAAGARNGSIVVMHMNGRGCHTAEALPAIIEELHRKGFGLVTVGDLMRGSRGDD
jgi:peptidoglycan/xylan/chitin deacetylase (PgdA/CDA1 family)